MIALNRLLNSTALLNHELGTVRYHMQKQDRRFIHLIYSFLMVPALPALIICCYVLVVFPPRTATNTVNTFSTIFFLRILAGRSAYRCPRCTRIFTWQETPCDPLVELPPCRLRDWWSTHRVLDARWIVGARAWGLFGAIGGFGFWLLWRFWVRWDSQVAT